MTSTKWAHRPLFCVAGFLFSKAKLFARTLGRYRLTSGCQQQQRIISEKLLVGEMKKKVKLLVWIASASKSHPDNVDRKEVLY